MLKRELIWRYMMTTGKIIVMVLLIVLEITARGGYGQTTTKGTPPALDEKDRITTFQKCLLARGLYHGPIDGNPKMDLELAVKAWGRMNGFIREKAPRAPGPPSVADAITTTFQDMER